MVPTTLYSSYVTHQNYSGSAVAFPRIQDKNSMVQIPVLGQMRQSLGAKSELGLKPRRY